MDRQDVDHTAALFVDHTAAQLHAVVIQRSFDESMGPFEGHIGNTKKLHVESKDRAAHLNGGVAGLGIHAAHMGNADGQIHIPHDFRIKDVRHFFQLLLLMCLPVIEGDKLQSRTLRICR